MELCQRCLSLFFQFFYIYNLNRILNNIRNGRFFSIKGSKLKRIEQHFKLINFTGDVKIIEKQVLTCLLTTLKNNLSQLVDHNRIAEICQNTNICYYFLMLEKVHQNLDLFRILCRLLIPKIKKLLGLISMTLDPKIEHSKDVGRLNLI